MDWDAFVDAFRGHALERRLEQVEPTDVVLVWAGSLEQHEVGVRFRSRVVGAAAAFRREPRTTVLAQTSEELEMVVVPREVFLDQCDKDAALREAALGEAVDEASLRGHAFHGLGHVLTKEHFPGTRAIYAPGPYVSEEVEVVSVPVALDPGWLQRVVPPRVRPTLRHGWLMVTAWSGFHPKLHPDGPRFDYTETGLIVPCQVDGHPLPRAYVLWLFPNSLMALYGGRELYGLPKMFGNTRVTPDGVVLLTRASEADGADPTFRTLEFRTVPVRGRWLRRAAELRITRAWMRIGAEAANRQAERKRLPPMEMVGWKRNFSTSARYRAPRKTWRPEDFHVDGLAPSTMRVRSVVPGSFEVFEVRDFHAREPLGHPPVPLTDLGLRYRCAMTMEPGGPLLVDYRTATLSPAEKRQLAWGEAVWKHRSVL